MPTPRGARRLRRGRLQATVAERVGDTRTRRSNIFAPALAGELREEAAVVHDEVEQEARSATHAPKPKEGKAQRGDYGAWAI